MQSREPSALLSLPFGSVCLFVPFQWLHGAGLCAVVGDLWLDCAALTFAMVPELTLPAVWGPRCAPVALGRSASGRPASRSELSMTQNRHSPETAPQTTRFLFVVSALGHAGPLQASQSASAARGRTHRLRMGARPQSRFGPHQIWLGPDRSKFNFCVFGPQKCFLHPQNTWEVAPCGRELPGLRFFGFGPGL